MRRVTSHQSSHHARAQLMNYAAANVLPDSVELKNVPSTVKPDVPLCHSAEKPKTKYMHYKKNGTFLKNERHVHSSDVSYNINSEKNQYENIGFRPN